MVYKFLNYAHMVIPAYQDNDIFIKCNFARYGKDVPVFAAKSLVFNDCNLIGCKVPSDAILKGINTIGECVEPEPEIELTEEQILAQQVNDKAVHNTNAMREALLGVASIDQTIGLYNSDGVERLKKAVE